MEKKIFVFLFCLILLGTLASNGAWGQGRTPTRSGIDPRTGRPVGVLRNAPGQPNPQTRGGYPPPTSAQRIAQSATGAARTHCLLRSSRKPGSTDLIEIVIEGAGTVNADAAPGSQEQEGAKMELVAGFRYEERTLEYQTSPELKLATLRQYEQAGMKQKLGTRLNRPLLDASRKNIVCRFDGRKTTLFSPSGPLKNDQYALLDELPCNTLLLDTLIPGRNVRLGEEWTISNELLAALLNFEAVKNNTLHLVLTAIVDDIAEVNFYLQGGKGEDGSPLPSTIEGAWQGASIQADLEGKFQFDLRSGRMTWFGMKIKENRTGSLVEPALNWNAQVRIKIAPLTAPKHLTEEALRELDLTVNDEKLALLYNAKVGPWSFSHERAWRMIEDDVKSAALCLVVQGEGIAQCNIVANSKVEPGKMASLDFYQKELRKNLGDRFKALVRAAEYKNEQGYLVYAVLIDGEFEQVPFRWIYYLMTHPEGEQISLLFEVHADKLTIFNQYAQRILSSFRIVK